MQLSIVISVLNSHELVRRHLLHYEKMPLPDDVEIVLMDDGSDPQLVFPDCKLKNLVIYPTGDTRPWTVSLARNLGAKLAKGKYLLMTDIDYIITKEAIETSLTVTEDKMSFKRQFGVLDENGNFTQDLDVLRSYGLSEERINRKGVFLSPHPNNFVMRKETYFMLGGYREDRIGWAYPAGEDRWFKAVWTQFYQQGKVLLANYRAILYMFPNGQFCEGGDVDSNPFGLMHGLSRKSPRNPYQNENLSS